ncbi:MAG: hypothetical protein GEV13_09255 [Rhodospirillales bacterium]|nr:hypothetical protein [Rhodospirillales bacterium]
MAAPAARSAWPRSRARHPTAGAGHREGPAGQDLPGVPGLREGQREEGAVRHGRHWRCLASRRPDAEQHDEGRRAGDSVQGNRSALNDLVSGQFDYMVSQVVNVLPQIKSGNSKALGVSTTKRLSQLPDVPTIDEAGLKGHEVTIWNGFFAPRARPKTSSPSNQAPVTTLSDEALTAQLKASIDKWVAAVRAAGVKPE